MRITADEKQATKTRILAAAQQLFRQRSFEAATTRDIAHAAGIAVGTLFNYFSTKEAIIGALAAEAWAEARQRFQRPVDAEIDEVLFSLIAAELRQLQFLRSFFAPLLDAAYSPLALSSQEPSAETVRTAHLELVTSLFREHAWGELPPLAMNVYWTLYTGVLAFWSRDQSPKQEDTLALLDQSLAMFLTWLRAEAEPPTQPPALSQSNATKK